MITDPMGAEIRPTLHVPFVDYDELLKENKRLKEALAKEIKYWEHQLTTYKPTQLEYLKAKRRIHIMNIVLDECALDTARGS